MDELDHPPWATALVLLAHTIWVIFLSFVLVDKLIVGSWIEYIEHFTNWSLTFLLLFGFLAFIYYPWKPIYRCVMLLLYLPVYGTTWVVYLGVAVIFLLNPDLLLDYFKRYDAGFVIVANEIFHSLPLIVHTTYGWYHAAVIRHAIKHNFKYCLHRYGWDGAIWFVLYQVYFPILIIGFYRLVFDPNEIYGVNIPAWAAAIGIFIILTIFNGIPVLYIITWTSRKLKPCD